MLLHDQTRRFIALLIFFLFGPMLTVGILVGIGLRKLPSNARKLEHELSVQTGLQWKIHAVEFRKPGCIRLKDVHILDDVSAKSVFQADAIDLERQRNKKNESILLVKIPNTVVKLDHYANDESAGQVVHSFLAKLLTRFPQLSETVIQFDFEKVGIFTTHSRKKPGKIKFELLRFVLGNLYRTEDGVRSDWSFELPEVSEVETQRLSFFRRAATGGAEIEFQTGKIPVPVEVIAPFCPVFGQFGSGCRLSGVFSVEFHSDTGFTGFQPRTVRIADAVFRRIDLSRIASYYTSFAVSGAVDSLHVRKAVFGPDTFFADGAFMLVDGFIDKTLFNRFVRQFDLTVQPGELIESPQKTVPFEECVLQFRLAPDGLAFWPEESWGDVFMYRNGDGFRTENMTVRFPGTVSASSRRPISYHALLSVLAPDTAPVVPLTPSLKQLYSVIPVESELQPTQAPAREGSPYPVMVDPARANPAKANQTRAVEN